MPGSATGIVVLHRILTEIERAEHRIRPHVRCTSLIPSPVLGQGARRTVLLKAENLQLTGSFKIRGALNKLMALGEAGHSRVVTASSGNHAMAVAFALGLTRLRGKIFLPEDVSQIKLRALERAGADLQLVAGECLDAEKEARRWAESHGLAYVSPYNDPEVVGGQGTLGVELARQTPDLDAVFVAVGGGGLISGTAAWLKKVNPRIRVVACSPLHSCAMHESLQAGRLLEVESLPTLSDGTAGSIEADSITFELCQTLVDDSVVVTEEEIEAAMKLMLQRHRLVVEGAAGVAVAGFLKAAVPSARCAVVLCGGNVSREVLGRITASGASLRQSAASSSSA